jgi:Tol biopolymer transport system component
MRPPFITLFTLVATAVACIGGDGSAGIDKQAGGTISFWSDRAAGRAQVYTMNEDGTGIRRLTNQFSAKRGVWSPDGRRLAFDGRSRPTLHDFDIFVANADGSRVRKVTRGPARDTNAAWSPDGRWLAFMRDARDGQVPDVWVVRSDGKRARRIASGGPPAWSPDGRIAVPSPSGVVLYARDGRRVGALRIGFSEAPAWSPDRRRIVFTRFNGDNAEVYVANADGSKPRRLTRRLGEDLAAAWSPDGSRILFTSNRTGNRDVYVMGLDGTDVVNLTRNLAEDWATAWNPR